MGGLFPKAKFIALVAHESLADNICWMRSLNLLRLVAFGCSTFPSLQMTEREREGGDYHCIRSAALLMLMFSLSLIFFSMIGITNKQAENVKS